MAITLTAPLGNVITDEGRVDVKSLARSIDVTVPSIARTLHKSARYLHDHPTARSVQPRALQLVDRVNTLAGELGGLKFALAWLKTPTPELGGRSAMDLITSGEDRDFEVALGHIDSFLMADPD
jgi:hypothetical protein